ncbi:hypothetical protein HOO54_20945 [Bacillus sp. WMMC1349]|uniref:hypothetical protein n=1 Tax=Bacillus sp. WMMC1349 TaxID=2736254 RepID=UPI0015531B04|nr:hypothetical protein [Bacillus sp. WMMC1349]NPC94625.1 hypothetical protein [Bacillus sp. WMMC1349]
MKKRLISLSLVLACTLFITACGKDKFEEVTYKKGFPKEASDGLIEFMKHTLTRSTDQKLFGKNGITVFSTAAINQKQDIHYSQYTKDQLIEYYKPLSIAKNPKKTLNEELYKSEPLEKSLYHSINNHEKYNLPQVKILRNNQLEVKTKKNNKILDLPVLLKRYGVKNSDELKINLYVVNAKCFSLVIQDYSIKDSVNSTVGLFITQDLSNIKTTVIAKEKLQKTLSTGKLKNFYNLLDKIDESGRYSLLFFDDMILDKKANQLKEIKKNDYLSEDGKYVYINGRKEKERDVMPDGVQKIQTIDNYLKGNDKYEAQFKIDFENIANEMNFKSDAVSMAYICYFNENFAVLSVAYNGRLVGTAGEVNVLIDLKNKTQPTAFLVDLGIMSKRDF